MILKPEMRLLNQIFNMKAQKKTNILLVILFFLIFLDLFITYFALLHEGIYETNTILSSLISVYGFSALIFYFVMMIMIINILKIVSLLINLETEFRAVVLFYIFISFWAIIGNVVVFVSTIIFG